MALTSKQRRELLKFIKNLERYRGRHTELVSVYIPSGYDMNKIINHLYQEQGTASNIKDATTRKNVNDSLERMIQHLRLFKKTPENGLAVFAGNTAVITFFGSGFNFPFGDIAATSGVLTGTLADGTPLAKRAADHAHAVRWSIQAAAMSEVAGNQSGTVKT